MKKKRIVVLSGAGISAESGLLTFRDSDGLWEGHDVMAVATPEGFAANPDLVHAFYNARRRQLLEVEPNEGHKVLAELEQHFDVRIITQNVDNLHERGGSSHVLHLHGELLKVCSTRNPELVLDWPTDLSVRDRHANGDCLRPKIVWFGENVPELYNAAAICQTADVLIVVGTSLQVYPAAGLIHEIPGQTPVYYIDPKPATVTGLHNRLTVIQDVASSGLTQLQSILLQMI